jgi:hypothetical protein
VKGCPTLGCGHQSGHAGECGPLLDLTPEEMRQAGFRAIIDEVGPYTHPAEVPGAQAGAGGQGPGLPTLLEPVFTGMDLGADGGDATVVRCGGCGAEAPSHPEVVHTPGCPAMPQPSESILHGFTLEPVASSPDVAAAFREEQLALAKAHAEEFARQDAALSLVKHLSGTLGLSVRREEDEKGSPRFTLLASRVETDGKTGVEVLVPCAPWHHLEDAIERFVRTTLTPREYR